jgi:hypothetical protein
MALWKFYLRSNSDDNVRIKLDRMYNDGGDPENDVLTPREEILLEAIDKLGYRVTHRLVLQKPDPVGNE